MEGLELRVTLVTDDNINVLIEQYENDKITLDW